jgi:hypothetical protein
MTAPAATATATMTAKGIAITMAMAMGMAIEVAWNAAIPAWPRASRLWRFASMCQHPLRQRPRRLRHQLRVPIP